MTLDIHNYIVSLEGVDLAKVLSSWTWLTGLDKTIIALTKAGDMLLRDPESKLYFLNVGSGTIEMIPEDYNDFIENRLAYGVLEYLLMPLLVDKLDICNIKLAESQVYSYTLLPILGGEYNENNMFAVNLYEHYGLTGEIHFQLKDLPDGTQVNIDVVD